MASVTASSSSSSAAGAAAVVEQDTMSLAGVPSKRTLFYSPTAQQRDEALDTVFRKYINKRYNLELRDYWELHQWSCDNMNELWKSMWDWSGVIGERQGDLLFDNSVPMDTVNPRLLRAKLNYAENLLLAHNRARSNESAIISVVEPDPRLINSSEQYLDSTFLRSFTFEQLYQEVRKLAHVFKTEYGIKPGDFVVAFAPSNAEVIVACLAVTALGGIWSSCPSEFGEQAVLDRFEQIKPKVVISADQYRYNGKTLPVYPKLETILAQLPTVKHVIIVGQLNRDRNPVVPFPQDTQGRPWERYNDVIKRGESAPKEIEFHRGDAMAPVYVLYSSGTTGKPKAIVHSVGGMVLSLKSTHSISSGYIPGDVMLQFSTLGWMMHNYATSTLMLGCTVVAYDGSPLNPQSILFSLVDKYKVTILGISPRYLQVLETANYLPNQHHSLKSLKTITTAGSVLKAELYDWVYVNVGKQVFINNGTGGTDICNCFIGGVRSLPVYHAEIQAPVLGMDLQCWSDEGERLIGQEGEMVIAQPFPNMPIGFWNDKGDKRYKSTYFEAYKQPVWTHGDWIEQHSLTGGVTVFGRSDAILNPQGVRFGTGELYSAVEHLESVEDTIAVAQKLRDGDERVVLFVKPKNGPLNDSIRNEIKSAIKQALSTRHLPAKIIQCDKIPYTTNGKKLEVPTKKLVNGVKYDSLNLSSAEDPACLRFFVNHPELILPGVKAKL
ncbi:hypothetical protein OIO90_000247 [Microbotryomycetes sp. JL221]|nr:hypothetical protein OIO90_000247 [Microbotryomycetes sp. JL221]